MRSNRMFSWTAALAGILLVSAATWGAACSAARHTFSLVYGTFLSINFGSDAVLAQTPRRDAPKVAFVQARSFLQRLMQRAHSLGGFMWRMSPAK